MNARATQLATVLVLAALALAGCGSAAASRPDAKPVAQVSVPSFHPPPPKLPAGHAPGALYVLDLSNTGKTEPAALDFASDGVLLHLRWSSWGGSVAVAHGTALLRDCHPDCATGRLVPYPGTVKLSGLESCYDAHFYVDSSVVAETTNGPWRLASFMLNPCSPGR
jgi:hypothetical protein